MNNLPTWWSLIFPDDNIALHINQLMLIRAAQPDDTLAVARVHVRSWQQAYRGLLPQDYLDSLNAEQRAARYDFGNADLSKPKTFLAVNGESVMGFVTISPAADAGHAECGELSALYVDPDHWHGGIGTRLLVHAQNQMVARGYRRAILWVLQGNANAGQFYRARGWMADGQQRRAVVWGMDVGEERYQYVLDSSTSV